MRGWFSSRSDVRRLSRRVDIVETAGLDTDAMTDTLAARQAEVEQREAGVRAQLAAVEQQAADLHTLATTYVSAVTESRQDRAALWDAVHTLQGGTDHSHPAYAAALTALTTRLTADEATLTTAAAAAAQAQSAAAALTARITAAENRAVQIRRATPTLPLIALGATYEHPITWTSPLPSGVYALDLVPSAGLLGKATVTIKPGTQATTGVTLRITAGLLIAAGQTLDITATWQGTP